MRIEPFRIAIPEDRLQWVLGRFTDARWPTLPDEEPWRHGVDDGDLRDFVDHIVNDYDWRAEEAKLNAFPQFMADIDGQGVHFIHAKSDRDDAPTVILSHGWPSTHADFMGVIDRLTHPERHGGRAEDALHLVIPSLPGYGFSPMPRRIIGPPNFARQFDRLMTEGLVLDSYIPQGGDVGSVISSWMAWRSPAVRALHLNYNGWFQPGQKPETPEEAEAVARWHNLRDDDGGYSHLAATRPLNLAYAFTDSPLGAAAWIFARYKRGIDDLWSVYDKDALSTTVMIFLLTGSLPSSMNSYRGLRIDEQRPADSIIDVPTAFLRFPGEIASFPKSFLEKTYTNIVRWTDAPAGGHFAAFEQPELFCADLLAFCRDVTDGTFD